MCLQYVARKRRHRIVNPPLYAHTCANECDDGTEVDHGQARVACLPMVLDRAKHCSTTSQDRVPLPNLPLPHLTTHHCLKVTFLVVSMQSQALLERMQHDFGNESPRSLKPLCPTRWTVKHKTFQSVLVNYEPLLETLDRISSGSDGSSRLEIRSKAGGIYQSLQTFDCLFGIMLSERFFGLADSLSSSLQGKNLTAFDAKKVAETVSKKLLSLRTDT